MALHLIGVRHHSPACARLVRAVIAETRPSHVLIEGPADFNARLDELLLPHELPVALFTYYRDEERHHASWTPFCSYSPEWIALAEGHAVGATVRFCDLPAWHAAFSQRRNRYADEYGEAEVAASERWQALLLERFGVDNVDTLWDHLFEQPLPTEELRARLEAHFRALRADDEPGGRDGPREATMAAFVAWAMREANGRDVVLVCGGWHAPAIERAWREVQAPQAEPQIETPGAQVRHGSYLVPYSYRRLDSFTGYESGMPSPAYYEALWEHGAERGNEVMLQTIARGLRQKKQPLSTADLVACMGFAHTIARLRGHRSLARTDLLDAVAAALLKEGLEVPLPWSERGLLRPGTDPLLVEVVAALSGQREGKLAPATPRPPLLADVTQQLEAHGLAPGAAARDVTLSLTAAADLARSRVLHRLRVLRISGFTRAGGPEDATDAQLTEVWRIVQTAATESELIEAAAYGATLETAAGAALEEALAGAQGELATLAAVFSEAAFAGLMAVAQRVLPQIRAGIAAEPALDVLGEAGERLLGLYRHGELLGTAGDVGLAVALEAVFDRGLWLVEGVQGGPAPADPGQLAAVAMLRDLLRTGPPALALARDRAHGVMLRKASDRGAPPALCGAALGLLWSTAHFADPAQGADTALQALRLAAAPRTLGDFLAGLFALAREEVLAAAGLLTAIDEVVSAQPMQEFLVGLPALRLAFSYFPPRERERIGRQIAAVHAGASGSEAAARIHIDLRLEQDPAVLARGLELELTVAAAMRRFGLLPPQ